MYRERLQLRWRFEFIKQYLHRLSEFQWIDNCRPHFSSRLWNISQFSLPSECKRHAHLYPANDTNLHHISSRAEQVYL